MGIENEPARTGCWGVGGEMGRGERERLRQRERLRWRENVGGEWDGRESENEIEN